jgi:hypothetical protein
MTPIILVALVVVLGLVYIFTSPGTTPQRGAANSASQPTNAPGTSNDIAGQLSPSTPPGQDHAQSLRATATGLH